MGGEYASDLDLGTKDMTVLLEEVLEGLPLVSPGSFSERGLNTTCELRTKLDYIVEARIWWGEIDATLWEEVARRRVH